MTRRHPHLYEINTLPWLRARSRRAARALARGSVPAGGGGALRDLGIDIVYLMGIWRRSRIGREIARGEPSLFPSYDAALPGWRARDVAGSAYSIAAYEPDPAVGTWDEVDALRDRLHSHGMRLIVDFIPNHTGFDHPWIVGQPDRYVNAPEEIFRESPGAFRAVELPEGDVRFIACGRDPYFPPWTDVAQLNYADTTTRAAMIDVLRTIAAHADGARCDMAMLVLSDVFARTWGSLTGEPPAREFWEDAARAVPGFMLIAEVYWDLEERLQQLGFQFTYDKRLYDRLVEGDGFGVHDHLHGADDVQQKSARFIENHDEPRSAAVFGARQPAAAVAMSTVPGLRFYYDGQFDGCRVRVPVQLGASAEESGDDRVRAFYRALLPIVDAPAFHDGEWRLCPVRGIDETTRQLAAWRWKSAGALHVVAVNVGGQPAQGFVDIASDLDDGDAFSFTDLLDGRSYRWSRGDLAGKGLYVRLSTGQAHIFSVTRAS